MEPAKYKSDMYEALIKMIEADLITFPDWYQKNGFLSMMDIDEKLLAKKRKQLEDKYQNMELSSEEYEEKLAEEMDRLDIAKIKTYMLSPEEEAALGQIDAMKMEALQICRYKRDAGKDMFKLPPDKDAASGGHYHDDRVDCLAMLAWALMQKRTEHIRAKKKTVEKSVVDILPMRAPMKWRK